MRLNRPAATLLSGLAGGLAWIGGMVLFFGPAQAILADPRYQSEKFYEVLTNPAQPPRMVETFWIVPAGLMVLGLVYATVFAIIERGLPGKGTSARGLTFGACAWALSFIWFEFYLPWNVLREPAPLVLLELACWLGTMLLVGLAISWAWRLTRGATS